MMSGIITDPGNRYLPVCQVEERFVQPLPILSHNTTGLYTSQSALNLTLTSHHFTEAGDIRIELETEVAKDYAKFYYFPKTDTNRIIIKDRQLSDTMLTNPPFQHI